MANADHKHHGPSVRGKGDGTGAMTDLGGGLPANAVLSNRDKKQHSQSRGLDGRAAQMEQRQDDETAPD